MIYRILLLLVLFFSFPFSGMTQNVEKQEIQSIGQPVDTLLLNGKVDSIMPAVVVKDSLARNKQVKMPFKPDPKKAVLMAIVPGLGQIYNHKYWKLPIVYGGLMGCFYAVSWNNRNYKDYSTAYKDIILDSEHSNSPEKFQSSWQDFIPVGADPTEWVNNTTFQNQLKSRKDYYRKYRDLSILISIGVYAITIIDAYVDAQLFDFDISEDLSMHWEPAVTPHTKYSSRTYGLNCSIKF